MKRSFMMLCLLLSACDSSPQPPQAEHKPNPIAETQIQAIKKAQAVQEQVDDAAEAQRKQIEAAEK